LTWRWCPLGDTRKRPLGPRHLWNGQFCPHSQKKWGRTKGREGQGKGTRGEAGKQQTSWVGRTKLSKGRKPFTPPKLILLWRAAGVETKKGKGRRGVKKANWEKGLKRTSFRKKERTPHTTQPVKRHRDPSGESRRKSLGTREEPGHQSQTFEFNPLKRRRETKPGPHRSVPGTPGGQAETGGPKRPEAVKEKSAGLTGELSK